MESVADTRVLVWALPVVALTSLLALWVLTPPLIRLCHRFELFDYPNARKRHLLPTPRLGGTAIALGAGAALFLGQALWPELFVDFSSQWPGIFWAGLLILALGIYDDVAGAPAYVKLMGQIVAALLLCLWDLRIDTVWVPFVGRTALGLWSIPLTVTWFLVVCNAINLLDGLDGLAAGIATIGGAFLALVGILWSIPHVALLGAVLVGAGLGFLRYNYPPAQIFMGDSGSLFLGFLFAVASISVPIRTLTAVTMALPLLAVWIPLVEVATSASRRIWSGRSPMRADHAHWHHLLARRGWPMRRILWTYYAMAFGFGLFVPALRLFDRYLVLPVFISFCIFVVAYMTSQTRPPRARWEEGQESSEAPVEHARV